MSVCRLAIAMNYIDDSLVEEAIEYEVHNIITERKICVT